MEIMYIKYSNGQRHSTIKEGENIIMTNSKIIPFNSIKKINENEITPYSKIRKDINHNSKENIDDKITDFFFNAIHQNYLSNRKK